MHLNTHHLIVDRLRMSGDIGPFPYAFIAWFSIRHGNVFIIYFNTLLLLLLLLIIDYLRGLKKDSTRLRTGKSGVRFRIDARMFLYAPKRPDRFWGPHNALLKGYRILSWR
jgi:hypothetical protein